MEFCPYHDPSAYQNCLSTSLLLETLCYQKIYELSGLTPVQDHRFLAMVYQYRHFDLAYGLLTGMYLVRMKEKDHLNGKPVEVIHLTSDDGPPMDVYVDTEPFLIVKVTGYFTVSDGRPTTLSSEFSDFRKVGDMVFPFAVINYAGGQKIAETRMKTYRINPRLEDSLFLP